MPDAGTVELIEAALAERLAHAGRMPFVLGIAGAQGSGKSTVAAALAERVRASGRRCALLSLDDLYLDGSRRAALAAAVHPLLRTRGVPGTHDVALGLAVMEALEGEGGIRLPRFDKARDEPRPPAEWEVFDGPADVLLLEGWCVGTRPQAEAELAAPVNALERDEDADGCWRRFVNRRLAGSYAALFARIDLLVLLAAPGFGVVADWRIEQERALRREREAAGEPVDGIMSDAQVRRFVQHYQRITEHMLRQGPCWADLTIRLDAERRPLGARATLEMRRSPE